MVRLCAVLGPVEKGRRRTLDTHFCTNTQKHTQQTEKVCREGEDYQQTLSEIEQYHN